MFNLNFSLIVLWVYLKWIFNKFTFSEAIFLVKYYFTWAVLHIVKPLDAIVTLSTSFSAILVPNAYILLFCLCLPVGKLPNDYHVVLRGCDISFVRFQIRKQELKLVKYSLKWQNVRLPRWIYLVHLLRL